MTIGIVDVGIGNIGSLRGALYSQGWDTKTVSSPEEMVGITHLFLPGVGSFTNAMNSLKAARMVQPIKNHVTAGLPLMGICIGMQLMSDFGLEGGGAEGLGLISGNVVPFPKTPNLRSPHVGWNVMCPQQPHILLCGIRENVDFYFVHSYFFSAKYKSNIVGTTEYGISYPSFVASGNVVGVQFHPEKSQRNGLLLLDNFCNWDGKC